MADKKNTKKKVVNKPTVKKKEEKSDKTEKGFSFSFSIKVKEDGIDGTCKYDPAEELTEEQKKQLAIAVQRLFQGFHMRHKPIAPIVRKQSDIDKAKIEAFKEFQKAFSGFQTFN